MDGIRLRITDETAASGAGDTSLTYAVDGQVVGGSAYPTVHVGPSAEADRDGHA